MTEWRVMVVEDDRMVARLHCRFVAGMSGFSVIGVASDSRAGGADDRDAAARPRAA